MTARITINPRGNGVAGRAHAKPAAGMRNDKTRRIMHRRHFPVGGSHPLAMYGRRRPRVIVATTGARAAAATGRALPEAARRSESRPA
ncbi:MAG: hypothetical protein VB131_04110 [Burkholderia gladioli]